MPDIDAVLAAARELGDVDLKRSPLLSDAFELGPPYKVAILHMLMRRRMLLRDPVGTGKTACALGSYATYRVNAQAPTRLIVLTTSSAQFQWKDEVTRLTKLASAVYSYEGRKELSAAHRQQRILDSPHIDVWAMTYAMAALELPTLLRLGKILLVFDEVQIIRGARQKNLHPAARALSLKAECVWGLSATPIMNKIENLHGIFDAIVPGLLGNVWQYMDRYTRHIELTRKVDKRKFKKLIGYKNEKELTARIEPYTLQRDESVFDKYLPKMTPLRKAVVEMGPAQRKLYTNYLKGLTAEGAKTNKQKITAILHAQMICSAPAVLGHPEVPSAKWEELKRLLTEDMPDKPFLVYTFWASTARWLQDQFKAVGLSVGLVTGSMSPLARRAVQQDFEAGKLSGVILTSAGAYGVNLRAPVFWFYDVPWVWGDALQAVGRARRRVLGGAPGTLLIGAVHVANSINDATLLALSKSHQLSQTLLAPLSQIPNENADSRITPTTLTNSSSFGRSRDPEAYKSIKSTDLFSEEFEQQNLSELLAEHTPVDLLWASLQGAEVPEVAPLLFDRDASEPLDAAGV